jgi:hypothetical protein
LRIDDLGELLGLGVDLGSALRDDLNFSGRRIDRKPGVDRVVAQFEIRDDRSANVKDELEAKLHCKNGVLG